MTDMEPAQAIAVIKAILGLTPDQPVAPATVPPAANWDSILAHAYDLPAEFKVELITAMGFQPTGSDHQWDCGYQFDPGIRCNCIPPATVWSQPCDVDVLRGETMEQRRNDKRDRRIFAAERS